MKSDPLSTLHAAAMAGKITPTNARQSAELAAMEPNAHELRFVVRTLDAQAKALRDSVRVLAPRVEHVVPLVSIGPPGYEVDACGEPVEMPEITCEQCCGSGHIYNPWPHARECLTCQGRGRFVPAYYPEGVPTLEPVATPVAKFSDEFREFWRMPRSGGK